MKGAYYNEIDPYAAQWLRNLIAEGHIAAGDVDERSIIEVQPSDLRGYVQCHFFAGIGGWSYALRLADWPDDRPVWTGSCPCQPLSGAGQRKGHADERHLWPAFYRLIAERDPSTVFGEQVASADGREWLAGVRADLEAVGYAVGAADLCSAGCGSPHIRQRLYWLADADGRHASAARLQRGWQHGQQSQDGGGGGVAYSGGERRQQVGRGASGDEGADGRQPDGDHVASSHGADGAGGVGNTQSGGRGERRDAARSGQGGHALSSIWAAFEYIRCTDGQARRVEPGSFPLAHGLPENMGCDGAGEVSPFRVITDPKTGKSIGQSPWRIGMLRAYGNAIVPQVAAKFIAAFMECAP